MTDSGWWVYWYLIKVFKLFVFENFHNKTMKTIQGTDTIMKMNRQVRLEENIHKQIFDKGLVSRIYRNPLNSIIKWQNSIQNGPKI